MRNIKRKDFDYYLTNLDWNDGSDIERDIKQFTRNDVFEHTYERPGFYSIKGLVFKYNDLMINALPTAKVDMSDGYENEFRYIQNHPLNGDMGNTQSGSFFGFGNYGNAVLPFPGYGDPPQTSDIDDFNNVEVVSKSPILSLKNEQLELDLNDVGEGDKFVIREMFNKDTPVFIVTPNAFVSSSVYNGNSTTKGVLRNAYGMFREEQRPWLENCIVGMIEHRPRIEEKTDKFFESYAPELSRRYMKRKKETDQLPGICINMPVKMSFAENDHIQISMDLNLPNPNLDLRPDDPNYGKSNYAVRVRMHPPEADGTTDWGTKIDDMIYVDGTGESFNKSMEDGGRGKNDGWQTVKHISFAQPRDKIDSSGNEIPNGAFDVVYVKIEIYPNGLSQLSQIAQAPELVNNVFGDVDDQRGPSNQNRHIYHHENVQYIAMRNISIKFPNTKGIIRPVEWQRFKSNMVVNPRIDYDSPLYEENEFAMIGGLSKDSSHFKTLASLISFDLEEDEYKESNLNSTYNEYDVLSMYDTMAKYDDKYYNKFLEPYTRRIHEDYAPYDVRNITEQQQFTEGSISGTRTAHLAVSASLYNKPKITDGMIDRKTHGVFKDTSLIDVDIASTKVYTAVIPMWKQLGFNTESGYNEPNSSLYWNNIIPKEYRLQNRTGITKRDLPNPQKGSLTPRIPREEYIVDESVDQEWINNYKWPVIPQLNKLGVFVSGSVDEPVYGGKSRWDEDDEISMITNVFSDNNNELKFNLNTNIDEIEELEDLKNNSFIRYVKDWTLHLDENKRISKNIIDQFDTIEKDIDKQAF